MVTLLMMSSRIEVRAAAAFPDALYRELAKTTGVADCVKSLHVSPSAAARAAYAVSIVKLTNGVVVLEAQGADPCLGAAPNGPVYAYVSNGSGYRQVLATAAVSAKFAGDGTLVTLATESALVWDRTTYRYDGTSYAIVKEEQVNKATSEAKPAEVPVHFSSGASSATLTGKVVLGFPDIYTLDATAGQTMSITVREKSGKVGELSISTMHSQSITSGSALSWHGKLKKSGSYEIVIDGSDETPATYTVTIAIE